MKKYRSSSKRSALWVAILVIGLGALFFFSQKASQPPTGSLDTFARCLKDKGVTFYGAFWCPHCQNQKRMFGSSAELLPYVECSTPDGRGKTDECIQKNISGYPTWEFADGSRESGEVPLVTLAEKSGCVLPE